MSQSPDETDPQPSMPEQTGAPSSDAPPADSTSAGGTSAGAQPAGGQPGGQAAEKPTSQWATGDEPMTGPQASYLSTLAREAGEELPDNLTKAQASDMIERLQGKSSRVDS